MKSKAMKKNNNIVVLLAVAILASLAVAATTKAQVLNKSWGRVLIPGIRNLQIGDKIPDLMMAKIINNDTSFAKTSDFEDYLLILDFWDTSCSACVISMPKLDSLQRKFRDKKVKILSVTWQKEAEIVNFFNANRFLKKQKIPIHRASVVEDRILGSYFRHKVLPHVVWINKGVIVAITSGVYVNEKNIQTLLDGKAINWPLKDDSFDKNMFFVTLNNAIQYSQNSKFLSYSVLTGQTNAVSKIGGLNYVLDTVSNITRIALFNQSILDAYKILSFNSDSIPRKFILTPKRLILEVNDLSKYIFDPKKDSQAIWNSENEICYELIKSGAVTERVMSKIAMKDLDNKLGLYGRWEKRKVKCLVFVKTSGEAAIDTLPTRKEGTSISDIAFSLDLARKYPPAIDETNFKGNIKLESYNNLEELRKALHQLGFDIVETERKIDVLVITELNK